MAKFEVHFPIGIISGVVLAAAGLNAHQIQPVEGVCVIALAAVGSCIPDIDSVSSIPHRYFGYFLTYGLPLILLLFLSPIIRSEPLLNVIFYSLFAVVSHRYLCPYVKTIFKHRGVLHTIPFALLCAELTYLLFVSDFELFDAASEKMPVYFGVAVFVGHISHLIADEFYSLYDEKEKTYKRKTSLGSALTMYSERSTPKINVTVYILVALTAFAINSDGVSLQSLWLMIVNAYG